MSFGRSIVFVIVTGIMCMVTFLVNTVIYLFYDVWVNYYDAVKTGQQAFWNQVNRNI